MKWFLVFAREKGEPEQQLLFKLLSREDADESVKLLICDWEATDPRIEEIEEMPHGAAAALPGVSQAVPKYASLAWARRSRPW